MTDAKLAHLHALTNLFKLDLRFTEVTDAGMSHLKGPTNLSELELGGTRVADAGEEEQRRALPDLDISRSAEFQFH